MKYIILLNGYDNITNLNNKYDYLHFITLDYKCNISENEILFYISYDIIENIETYNYNIYNINSDSDIENILLDYNILNIYYDMIFSISKLDIKISKYEIYDNKKTNSYTEPSSEEDNISFDSYDMKDITEELFIIIDFYIYSLVKSKKENYNRILLLINPIFRDNFEEIFKKLIKEHNHKKIALFNTFPFDLEITSAISFEKSVYDEILSELYKIKKYTIPNINKIIKKHNVLLTNNIEAFSEGDLIINENYYNINKNNFSYYSSIHNKINIIDFIKIHDIKQIFISKSLNNHNNIFKNKHKYKQISASTLFYGVYREQEINFINKHKGDIYIYWHDNDCNPNYNSRCNIVKKIINKPNILYHICNKIKTLKYLNHFKINPIFLNDKIKLIEDKDKDKKKYTYNDIFKNIFVISLKSDYLKKKLINLKFKDANIDFQFFDAVNGMDEPYLTEYRKYKKKPYNWNGAHFLEKRLKKKVIRSPGAYGYLKTWEKIILHAINNKLNKICIFDDDVLIDNFFHEKFNNFINEIKNNWLVINLGSTQHVWSDVKIIKDKKYYFTPKNTDGSFAVCLRYPIYDVLLKQIRLFNCAFDSGAMRNLFLNYPGYCYTLYPALVIADVTTSAIGSNRNLYDFSNKIKWDLSSINYSRYLNCVLTVIIPMYNAEKTIRLCLNSILNQTYKALEIIIIDDCSTDNSYKIVEEEYVNKHYNFKVYKTEVNSGCYVARNLGIKKSTSKFITFHDVDDISYEERYEIQINIMLKKKVLLCGCNFTRLKDNIVKDNYKDNIKNQINKYSFCKQRFGLVTLIYNKKIFKEVGLFREDYRHSMDNEFVERVYYYFYKKKPNVAMHTLMSKNDKQIQKFFYKIDKLLYASTPVTINNISLIYKRSKRNNVKKLYINDIYNEKINYNFL
jgi:glycosyltransferase involved in cell wall biosynthesis